MLAIFSKVNTATDVDELVFLLGFAKEATQSFADLADRFRKATSSQLPPSILKHEINTVFATQAGDLLCQCWRRGVVSVYRSSFFLPDEGEPRIRYVFLWFTFIRWHLATVFKSRFRDDWKSEFAPEMDQLKGQDHYPQKDYQSAASEDANDLVVWRLNLYSDVQATACDILAEELGKLAEAVEQRLRQLPGGSSELPQGTKPEDVAGAYTTQPPQLLSPKQHLASWQEILVALGMQNNREDKQKVSRLNEAYNGPIKILGQGTQPFANKDKLIEWWNGLEKMVESQQEKARDKKATVSQTHGYGRDGKAVPEISGGVKKRRKYQKP